MRHVNRQMRLNELQDTLEREPFLTDEELSSRFRVSVQTIRLDRMALGIPEHRARLRELAEMQQSELRTLEPEEVFGDIVNLELGTSGISVWRAEKKHAFARSGIVRGHYIFAQANSLAVAIVNAKQALTAKATVRFAKSAKVGEVLVSKATVTGTRMGYTRVNVETKIDSEIIFIGDFLITSEVGRRIGGKAIDYRD